MTSLTPMPAMPLSLVGRGEHVIVHRIDGAEAARQRLLELGLNRGAHVRVMQNDHGGRMILAVKNDARLALGRGMAHHILVTSPGS